MGFSRRKIRIFGTRTVLMTSKYHVYTFALPFDGLQWAKNFCVDSALLGMAFQRKMCFKLIHFCVVILKLVSGLWQENGGRNCITKK